MPYYLSRPGVSLHAACDTTACVSLELQAGDERRACACAGALRGKLLDEAYVIDSSVIGGDVADHGAKHRRWLVHTVHPATCEHLVSNLGLGLSGHLVSDLGLRLGVRVRVR